MKPPLCPEGEVTHARRESGPTNACSRWCRRTACAGIVVLAGCAHRGPPPMYMWENFPRQQYESLSHAGTSPVEQISAMEAHAEKARAAGAALPPGFRAHLGMLKLSVGDVDQARVLLQAEKSAFPESAAYMDQLLKQLAEPATKENPA